MKKINLKLNLKQLTMKNRGTVWQKAILGVLLALALLFTVACGYLFFKPLSAEIKDIIDGEISAVDIIFDQKTIERVKERQKPLDNSGVTTGKNPFASF
jgi:flagellar motor component MotA